MPPIKTGGARHGCPRSDRNSHRGSASAVKDSAERCADAMKKMVAYGDHRCDAGEQPTEREPN